MVALVCAAATASVIPDKEVVLINDGHFTATDKGIVIDGITNTVATTLEKYLDGEIPAIFKTIIEWIANAINPPPDAMIDYFKVIALNVRNVVGLYVNQHNMDQILAYKGDLADLITRYSKAPVKSETYADKDTMANSLSVSIISNRFLIEAVEFPHSMMLHYADLASIHIAILKDAATTYSTTQKTSPWWVDLDNELGHYIGFGKNLTTSVVTWRNSMVSCSSKLCSSARQGEVATCYNKWRVVDKVAQYDNTCKALSGDHTCDNSCQDYKDDMNKDVQRFVFHYLGKVMATWEQLKITADEMAKKAKDGH